MTQEPALDGIHFGKLGHQKFAEQIYQELNND